MSEVRIEHVPPKKKASELSDFLCKEMLYEHLEGTLDQQRSDSVEKILQTSEESQDEFRMLLHGVEFCEALSKTEVSQEAMEKLVHHESGLSNLVVKQWGQWPIFLRSFAQASFIAGTTAFVVTLLPWEELPVISGIGSDRSIELVHLSPDKNEHAPEQPTSNIAKTRKEIKKVAEEPKPTVVVAVQPPIEIKEKKDPLPKPKVEKKVVVSPPPPVQPKVEEKPKPVASQHKGFVYRVFMDVPSESIEAATKEIADKIVELGGRKARSVELGRKMRGGRYFHLIIPDAGFEELQKFITKFAPIRKISKDSHKWVTKKGQVRSILWLEEVKQK